MKILTQAEEPFKSLTEDGACLSPGNNRLALFRDRARARSGSEDARTDREKRPKISQPARIETALLGTNAKSAAKNDGLHSVIDHDTGEILGLESAYDPDLARADRFIFQSVAKRLLPGSRVGKCFRLRQGQKDIEVLSSRQHNGNFYTGLQTCGSVWACPVCCAKISERRRGELKFAMAAHQVVGGKNYLLTLTAPHTRYDKIDGLLEKQAKALTGFWADRKVRAILAEMGFVGSVRALEVTHGRKREINNGWHAHYHFLLFVALGVDPARFDRDQLRDWEVRLFLRWEVKCDLAGLGKPSMAHGLKLDDGARAAAYVAKMGLEEPKHWGLEHELTKGHSKKANDGETPFDFLRAYYADASDKQAAALFIEFAGAFKGKRQLFWSVGLKKRYGVVEFTDEELAAKQDDQAIVLGMIELQQWHDVCAVEGRGTVLQLAKYGWSAVEEYLKSIKGEFSRLMQLRKDLKTVAAR